MDKVPLAVICDPANMEVVRRRGGLPAPGRRSLPAGHLIRTGPVRGTEVHPTVIWEKFKAMRDGADLASKQLWK
jgi:hypothetical protein